MDERKKTGNDGEDAAARFLMAREHEILARNWRAGHLEVDIITLAADGIHFVEVKTRRPPLQAEPQESVTPTKQKRLVRAALTYLNRSRDPRLGSVEYHFDIVAVTIDNPGMTIGYFPDAFIPIYI